MRLLHRIIPFLLLIAGLSIQVYGQEVESVTAINAKPRRISDQFKFTEGPAVDKQGNVYFTDQPNNKIWKYSIDGKLSVFMDKAGRSNGMYFDKKGNLITCADEKGELWSINTKGKVTVLLSDFQGHQFNGPNDLWVDPKEGIYFTDPYFQRDYWERKSPDPGIGGEKLYYIAKGSKEPVIADSDLKKPNGLIGTPDGKYLYVADMGPKKVYKYEIASDGSLKNRQTFADDLSDGMTIDEKGNVYLAGKGISVYNPQGKKIEQIDIPSGWTANVCFAGKNRDMLFITASESVYILPMRVKGVK